MIISNSKQFIFIHVPKNAGTTITRFLNPHLAWNDIVIGGTPFGEKVQPYYRKRYGLHKHATAAEIEKAIGDQTWKDYYKFAVVRHPFDRTLSWYFYLQKIREREKERGIVKITDAPQPKQWKTMRVYMESSSFGEFIRHRNFEKTHIGQTHFSALCDSRGKLELDAIIKVEDLSSDLARVAGYLNISIGEIGTANSSKRDSAADKLLTHENKELLYKIFKVDFEKFHYDPHL